MEFIQTNNAPQAIGPYSQAVITNGMLYTSGQIALTPEGTLVENEIKAQTRQVFANLKAILDEANTTPDNVVKVNIYLDSMDDFGVVNVIYAEFFGDHKPARSTVAVQTLPKNVLIEIDLIAIANNYH